MSSDLIGTKRTHGNTSTLKILGANADQNSPDIEEPSSKRPKIYEDNNNLVDKNDSKLFD